MQITLKYLLHFVLLFCYICGK